MGSRFYQGLIINNIYKQFPTLKAIKIIDFDRLVSWSDDKKHCHK